MEDDSEFEQLKRDALKRLRDGQFRANAEAYGYSEDEDEEEPMDVGIALGEGSFKVEPLLDRKKDYARRRNLEGTDAPRSDGIEWSRKQPPQRLQRRVASQCPFQLSATSLNPCMSRISICFRPMAINPWWRKSLSVWVVVSR